MKGFRTDGRPEELQTWIKYARKKKPAIEDLDKFVVEWKGWWMGLNPKWRVQGDVLLKEVKGPVESLRKPGANGFLSVLTGLKWWWEGKGATEEWIATFEDVTWAMSAVLGKRQVYP